FVPVWVAAGVEKTDVSNQSCPGPTLPKIFGSPVMFGRCVFPGACRLVALVVKSRGVPDCTNRMPVTCQPSSAHLAGPCSFCAKGICQTKLAAKQFIPSKPA